MKKVLSALLVAMLLACVATAALAADIDVTVQCTNTTTYADNPGSWNTGDHSGKVCIYHTVKSTSILYNNHFRVYGGGSLKVSGWCTPKQNIPLQNSGITQNMNIRLSARGNTYYSERHGINSVTLGGTYGWPL